YGISDEKYDDLRNVDIAGKVVLVIAEGEPLDAKGNSLITGSDMPSDWVTSRTKRLQNIVSKRPRLILATSSTVKEALDRMGGQLARPRIMLEGDANPPISATSAVANISTE